MRVIEALRYISAEWVIFCDLEVKNGERSNCSGHAGVL